MKVSTSDSADSLYERALRLRKENAELRREVAELTGKLAAADARVEHTEKQLASATINLQTPGPLLVWTLAPDSDPEERKILVNEDYELEVTGIIPRSADACLLAAAYNAFDKLGRELNVDAAQLAETLDLRGLLRATRAAAQSAYVTEAALAKQVLERANLPLRLPAQ